MHANPERLVWLDKIYVVFISVIVVLICLGPMWQAKWSVYADHEIQVYLGPTGHPSVLDIPSLILQTEVGHPGQVTRYRPTTYFMYILESVIWGNNPTAWHIGRIVVAAIALSVLALALLHFFEPLMTALLCIALFSAPYWAFVWVGIGPNEQYIILFLLPFCFSYSKIYGQTGNFVSHNWGEIMHWIIICISAIFILGTKENMFVIVPAVIWLYYKSFKEKPKIDYRLFLVFAVVACAGALFSIIAVGVASAKSDFYGNPITIGSRISSFGSTYFHSPLLVVTIVLIVMIGARYTLNRNGAATNGGVSLINSSIAIQAVLLIAMVSHAVFYSSWPEGSRYSFPGDFLVFISLTQTAYVVLTVVSLYKNDWRRPAELALSAVLLCLIALSGFSQIRASVDALVESSRRYTAQIETIVARARSEPSVPIIVESATPYDLEPVFSVDRFLKMRGVVSPLYLRLHDLKSASFPQDPFFLSLIDTLQELSKAGVMSPQHSAGTLPSPFLAKFDPIDQFHSGDRCFAITLAKAPTSGCEVLANVTY